MVGAELRLPQRQRLLVRASCARSIWPASAIADGEVVHARERVGVVGSELGGEGGAGLGISRIARSA